MQEQDLGQGIANLHARIQAAVGVLENHLHVAPKLAQRGRFQRADVDAIDLDTALRGLDQPQQQTAQGRLARPGLADQTQHLAFGEFERQVLDRPHHGP